MTRVSVMLCCYNGERAVQRALDSLLRQTLPTDRYETVFVNDGSTDATERVIEPYRRASSFRYLNHASNQGLTASCNHALREAQGEYVVRLDADDTFEPTILEEMCLLLDRGLTDFVSCDRFEWLADQRELRDVHIEPFDLFRLIAIGTMMRRSLVLEVGGYRQVFWEEYDLYLRYLLRSGQSPVHLPRALLTYTIHEGSLTADPLARQSGWEELQRLWPHGVLSRFGRVPVGEMAS